jgi:hypothetical protein
MTVNLVMYILVFLPVVCLSQIWDFYFAEQIEELPGGNFPQGSVCKFESIPELDLNDEGNESGGNREIGTNAENGSCGYGTEEGQHFAG